MLTPRMLRTLRRAFVRYADFWIVFGTGVLLRVQYVLVTNVNERAYDIQGHIDYLEHVLQTWSIPTFGMGWEGHQPPLYYFLAAGWSKLTQLLGRDAYLVLRDVQWFSFLTSVLLLMAAMWMTVTLFGKPSQRKQGLFFLGILCSLPGIVFFSARISNDALVAALQFLFVATLLVWWKTGENKWWYACVAVAGLGILTKLTMITAPLTLLICLYFRNNDRKEKWLLFETALLLWAALTGWFFMMRWSDGFLQSIPEGRPFGVLDVYKVPVTFTAMMGFSPVRILATTYNDYITSATGREFFWEYLFKSAFFGDGFFPAVLIWLHRAVLLGGLGTVFLAAVGVTREVRKRGAFWIPLLATLLTGLATIFLYRLFYNASTNQDFRFVPQVAAAIAAFAVLGLDAFTPRWRRFAGYWLFGFVIACGLFLLTVS